MKKYVDFVPRPDSKFLLWLIQYRDNFPRLAVTTMPYITQEQIDAHLAEVDEVIEALHDVERLKTSLAAGVTKKNLLREKITRSIRYWATGAKRSSTPAPEMVTGLRLVSVAQPVVIGEAAPRLTGTICPQGVEVGFDKQRFPAVSIFGRYPGETDWVFLGICVYSPFLDKRPLQVANQPERREYMAMYCEGERTMGQRSDIISVVFPG